MVPLQANPKMSSAPTMSNSTRSEGITTTNSPNHILSSMASQRALACYSRTGRSDKGKTRYTAITFFTMCLLQSWYNLNTYGKYKEVSQ